MTDTVGKGLLAVLLWAVVTVVHGALPYDPGRDWRTLETEHFRIHFAAEMEPLARRAAAVAESVHNDATEALAWRPRAKTEIVLVDDSDLPQAYAMPLPFNMIGLFVAVPEPGSPLQVDSLDQWLEKVLAHEYTHVIHQDKAAGLPLRLRRVLGRNLVTFPHVFQPLWLIEGLATHLETDHRAHVGRGQSAQTHMVMRTEVATGLRPLSQVHAPNRSWPAGQVPYLYGVMFHQFLEDRYGPERIRRFLDEYAVNLGPFQLDRTTRSVFGGDMGMLWSEFETWLYALYTPELNALRRDGLRRGDAVTEPGSVGRHEGGNVQALADGTVYYVEDRGDHRPRLVRRTPDGRSARVARLNRGARFSVHPDAGIMIAQPERCDEYRVHYDLFLLRHDARRPVRVTQCSRYRDVAWHPDGETLVAARIEQGRSSLHLVNHQGVQLQVLADSDDDAIIAQPHWSPDGTRIVVVRTQRGAGADLFEYVIADSSWRRLTDDPNFPVRPRYTRDGAHILFSSDHGGIHDIRRLDRASGRIDTLTRVESGAFEPSDGPDGVYFLLYGADGYQLRHLPHRAPTDRLPAPRQARDALAPRAMVDPAEVRTYDPLQTVLPTAWAPYGHFATDITELGVLLWGRDALGIHTWTLLPAVDLVRGGLVGTAAYAWSDRVYADVARAHDSGSRGVTESDRATLAWRVPYSQIEHSWQWFAGVGYDRERDRDLRTGVAPRPPVSDHVAGVALVFDSARAYRLSVSRQEGRDVRVVTERSVGGSAFSGGVTTLDWREFLHFGGSRVLALRYAHGTGSRSARPFTLGGTDTEQYPLLFSDRHGLFNKRRYSLRGYETGHPALVGEQMQVVAAEFRFPVRLVEWSGVPLGLDRWSGVVFAETGGAAARGETLRLHPAAGVEALFDVTFGYRFGGLRLRLGYAHGFDDEAGGADRVYLNIGSAF